MTNQHEQNNAQNSTTMRIILILFIIKVKYLQDDVAYLLDNLPRLEMFDSLTMPDLKKLRRSYSLKKIFLSDSQLLGKLVLVFPLLETLALSELKDPDLSLLNWLKHLVTLTITKTTTEFLQDLMDTCIPRLQR